MPPIRKFPPSAEIKRVIAAAVRAGIEIASIEIQPGRITLHAKMRSDIALGLTPYDLWKMSESEGAACSKSSVQKTDALADKSKG